MNEEELLEHLKTNGIESYWQQEMLVKYTDKLQKENEDLEQTIDNSLEEQKEREKYTHSLEQKLEHLKKENEELKEKNEDLRENLSFQTGKNFSELREEIKKDFISKNKIKSLLEKYDKDIAWNNADDHYYFTKFINELLEE